MPYVCDWAFLLPWGAGRGAARGAATAVARSGGPEQWAVHAKLQTRNERDSTACARFKFAQLACVYEYTHAVRMRMLRPFYLAA